MTTLAHWIEKAARHQPDAPALLAADRSWTFAELAAATRGAAGDLARQGIRRGEIVAFAGRPSETALAFAAASCAGCIFLPLDPALPPAEHAARAREIGARLLATPLNPLAPPLAPVTPAASEVALLIATSGSEGTPKLVQLTHANLAAAADASNDRLPLGPGDRWLACLPFHHIGGLSILTRCVRAGAAVLIHDDFDADRVGHDLAERAVSHVSLVPAMLARLVNRGDAAPACLKYALIGGAALSRPLFERAVAAGWPLCPSYGMSECASQVATLIRPGAGEWHEGLVGAPLRGFVVALGHNGRIRIRGPQLMRGYLAADGRPGVGRPDGWLATHDVGRIDSHGRLVILGRADDMLVSGGVNVHPLEVESCLAACPGVVDVAVTALTDPVWGDFLTALVVGSAEPATLAAWCRDHLPSAKRPRRFVTVAELPRNALGKFDRATLRALARDNLDAEGAPEARA